MVTVTRFSMQGIIHYPWLGSAAGGHAVESSPVNASKEEINMRQQPPAPAGTANRAVMTIVILLGMAFLSACGWSPAPQEIVSTLEVVVTVPVTPTAAPPDGDEPASTEAAQQPAATRTPNSLQATLDALMAGVPRPDAGSSTPATAIAPDDYVGMFEHA